VRNYACFVKLAWDLPKQKYPKEEHSLQGTGKGKAQNELIPLFALLVSAFPIPLICPLLLITCSALVQPWTIQNEVTPLIHGALLPTAITLS